MQGLLQIFFGGIDFSRVQFDDCSQAQKLRARCSLKIDRTDRGRCVFGDASAFAPSPASRYASARSTRSEIG